MRTAAIVVLAVLLFGPPRIAALQDSLAAARTLYQSAAYEEALTVLDRLRGAPPPAGVDAGMAGQYRAYCLLALGRQAEADRAIEEVVAGDPFFVPPEAEVSPRVRAAFQAVRHRMLPALAQQEYVTAKAAFDRKEYPGAVGQFSRVIALIEDPETTSDPALADLRTLAAGFRDLARAAIPPPPAPPPEPAPPPPSEPPPGYVYQATDAGVTPPVTRRQDLPRWPGAVQKPTGGLRGVIDVVIDESGRVVTAAVREPVDPRYDDLLVAAARSWRYTPAMKNGQPVRFIKRIQVVVQ